MKLSEIPFSKLKDEYVLAFEAMENLCLDVRDNDPEMFEEDPWTPEGFRYYIVVDDANAIFDGAVVAERKVVGMGPREPGYIWSGSLNQDDPHESRWFCSEDDLEEDEMFLGEQLNRLSPGGIGGW